jgi:hypothetical protein
MRLLLLTFLLLSCLSSNGQQTGCFKKDADSIPYLETTIDLKSYDAFFLGEFHGIYGVSEVKLALTKHLNKKYGVKDIFMEIGYSAAYLYNRYLETGDTTFFTSPLLALAYKKPNRDFWKGLYAYNRQLKNKVVIHAMDFERKEYIRVLSLLAPAGKPIPSELSLLSYLCTVSGNLSDINSHEADSLYIALRTDITNRSRQYAGYYGANIGLISEIMLNVNIPAKYRQRNETMYENVMREVKKKGIDKFMVIAGQIHANISDPQSLCGMLAQTPQLSRKVVSIGMLCHNCYDRQLPAGKKNVAFSAPYTYTNDTTLLGGIFTTHTNAACTYTLLPSVATGSVPVTRFSDYIILMKDQPEF